MNFRLRYMLILLALLLCVQSLRAQLLPASPLRETRAVWLTTIGGLDWPRTKATDARSRRQQQEELCRMLDRLQEAGINTILLQTRIRGSVIYPSRLEPWDACLTGRAGGNPGYDPLAFAVEECHRRGMTVHAWVVALQVAGNRYLDPSDPQAVSSLSAICQEIARGYDVDGISLDYIRYPEVPSAINDRRRYNANRRGLSYADWRRDCLTEVVRRVYNDVKAIKPYLWITSSPVGKYADASRYSAGGWNARDRVSQDVERWMREGLHDGVFPMMYFRGNNFFPFALQWRELAMDNGLSASTVCPGLGVYFMSPAEKNWPLTDITRELEFMRQIGVGQCYFRARFLTDNIKGLHDWLRLYHNAQPALPAALGARADAPSPPTDVTMTIYDMHHARLSWSAATVTRHNVYLLTSTCDTVLLRPLTDKYSYDFVPRAAFSLADTIAVCSIDRYGTESQWIKIPLMENVVTDVLPSAVQPRRKERGQVQILD